MPSSLLIVEGTCTASRSWRPSLNWVLLLVYAGSLELHEWCHGAISRNGADYLLKQHSKEGMYLVRESQSQPGQVRGSWTWRLVAIRVGD